jgi:hypothetical protein
MRVMAAMEEKEEEMERHLQLPVGNRHQHGIHVD